jgi:hypothetical protein
VQQAARHSWSCQHCWSSATGTASRSWQQRAAAKTPAHTQQQQQLTGCHALLPLPLLPLPLLLLRRTAATAMRPQTGSCRQQQRQHQVQLQELDNQKQEREQPAHTSTRRILTQEQPQQQLLPQAPQQPQRATCPGLMSC